MVERYLQGRLDADDESAFEEALLSDPELLDEVELTEKLQQGLREGAAGDSDAAMPGRGSSAQPRSLRLLGSVPYAAAATVLLGVAVAFSAVLLVQNRSLQTSAGAASGAVPTELVPLVAVRGGGSPNRISAPPADEWAVLLVEAGFGDYTDYRATLTRVAEGGTEQVAVLDGLSPSYDGRVGIGVPGRALTPGDYELLLEGRRAEQRFEQVTRIPMTVTAGR